MGSLRRAKKGYRQWPIATDDPRYHEGVTDIRRCAIAGENHYNRADNPPYWQSIPGSIPFLYARDSLTRELLFLNEVLRPFGLEVFIFDSWRPPPVQAHFHDVWFPARVRREHPDWDDGEVMRYVERFWAPSPGTLAAIDSLSPSPHLTAAAFDMGLRHRGGHLLWMGSLFDDCSPRVYPDYFEHPRHVRNLSDEEARDNRRLYYWLMTRLGFMVNPTEIWHVSFGDQMWAKLTTHLIGTFTPAHYGLCIPPGY